MQIKLENSPFRKADDALIVNHIEYTKVDLSDSPISIYIEKEMVFLVESATLSLEKRGMYRVLALNY